MTKNKLPTYKNSGVDIEAADDWVSRIQNSTPIDKKLITGVGDYAAVYAQCDTQWVATSCDGVGTKLLWTIEGLGSPEALAQDLLAMNANDVLCVGATPKLFLDYLAVGSKDLLKKGAILERFVGALSKLCSANQQLLVGGETAQMPDLYQSTHFDMAGFSVGFLKPEEFLTINNLKAGQSVWAWNSTGPHSNGFTLLRKLFDSKKDKAFICDELMKPTALYGDSFLKLRKNFHVYSAFHITGSGFYNFLRKQPEVGSIGFDLHAYSESLPKWIMSTQERAKLSTQEMCTTFNMGLGFAVVLDANLTQSKKDDLISLGLKQIGSVISQPKLVWNSITLQG